MTTTNTKITGKALIGTRDLFIDTLTGMELEVAGFEYVGRGVDGLVFANAEGTTVVAKIIVKKEVGIFNELVAEFDEREEARIAREQAAAEKKAKALEKKAKEQAKTEADAQ